MTAKKHPFSKSINNRPLFTLIGIVVVLAIAFVAVYQLVPRNYFQNNNANTALFPVNKNQNTNSQNVALTPTDIEIQKLEAELKLAPENIQVLLNLGTYYLQKVRETADTSYYTKIDDYAKKVLSLDPTMADALSIRAAVAAGRHHFTEALDLSSQAVKLSPKSPSHYSILADAQIELGMYKEAEQTLQIMVDIRPDFISYSRIAYFRELNNDVAGAIDVMQKALRAGASFKENLAWADVELGKLYFLNDPKAATDYFNQSLNYFPDFAPAYKWLGRSAFAQGDNQKALENVQKAFSILPIAEYAVDLSDLYKSTENLSEAKKYQTIVEATYQQYEKNGVDVDLEYSLFLSDHDLDPARALEKAKKAYEGRKGVYGADALAWAFYKNKMYEEATSYSEKALQLSTPEAAFYFHAGMIAKARGDKARAKVLLQKALGVNQNFSFIYTADYIKNEMKDL